MSLKKEEFSTNVLDPNYQFELFSFELPGFGFSSVRFY